MFKLLLVAAFVPALVLGIRQCPGGGGFPTNAHVNGCSASPCTIQNGAPVEASAYGITSPVAATQLHSFIVVKLLGLEIPFPMPPELADACAAGTAPGTCPVSAGDTFDYHLTHHGAPLPITGVTVQVEVGLRNENNALVACLQFDAHVVG